MTLPAIDSWNVRGIDGPKYKVGPYCSNPSCKRIAEHSHHIVRRSQAGGDYAWIEIVGKGVYANLTGLCPPCHDEITGRLAVGHLAAIRLIDDIFFWSTVVYDSRSGAITYTPVAPIDPQPPTPESLAARATGHTEESDDCPFCGQKRRRRSPAPVPPGGRRRRKNWNVKVPDDEEDGAGVLDILVEDLGALLDVEPDVGGRYYVLVPALVYAQQDRERFIASIKGKGG